MHIQIQIKDKYQETLGFKSHLLNNLRETENTLIYAAVYPPGFELQFRGGLDILVLELAPISTPPQTSKEGTVIWSLFAFTL